MKKLLVLSVTAVILVSSVSFAKVRAGGVAGWPGFVAGAGCMTENASISISFNSVEPDVSKIKGKMDAQLADIEKLMKEAGLSKYEMQSMNYSISPQNYGSMNSAYQMSGSFSFMVQPSDKATGLMASLTKKGYQANVNVSSYRNGQPCPQ